MDSRRLLIIGAGGHGKVVADAASSAGWSVRGFLDDGIAAGTLICGIPVLGSAQSLRFPHGEVDCVVVAVGNAATRLGLIARCLEAGISVPALVHSAAVVSRHAVLGPGTVVMAQAAINAGTQTGRGVIVNTGATVDHDCILGDGVHVCPGSHLAGDIVVGNETWIGIGSSVREGIRIAAHVTVGAGSTVVTDVGAGQTIMGVRARARSPK